MNTIYGHRHLLEEGQQIVARTWQGERVSGQIIEMAHRNGRNAVVFKKEDGTTGWCYLEQIRQVGNIVIRRGV